MTHVVEYNTHKFEIPFVLFQDKNHNRTVSIRINFPPSNIIPNISCILYINVWEGIVRFLTKKLQ